MILTGEDDVMPERVRSFLEQRLGASLAWTRLNRPSTTHRLFEAVDGEGQRWVARVKRDSSFAPGLDPAREQAILNDLADRSWIPQTRVHSLDPDVLVQAWAGEPIERSALNAQQLEQIVQLVTELHAVQSVHLLDYGRMFVQYRDAFRDWDAGYTQLVDETEQLLHQLPDLGECLVHHDLHLGNFCWGDSLKLIDWEYAGQCNPWFDYATLTRELDIELGALQRFPKLKDLSRSKLESGLAQAIECVDLLEQIWLHYRQLSVEERT